MNTLVFPELDARFEQLNNAVKVTQHGRTYLGRKWQLTTGLEHVIRTAIRFGYTSFWVAGHPSTPYLHGQQRFDRGIHHITFARSHQEKWVFVADKAPHASEVCFTRGLRDFLESIEEPHEWEHSGGHNLRIPLARLEHVLARLDHAHVDNLHRRREDRPAYVGTRPVVGLANESQLHRHIVETYTRPLRALGATLHSKVRAGPKAVPDLLLDLGADGLFVLELKFTHVSLVELDQLRKYLWSPLIAERSRDRSTHGVLIGRDFSPQLVAIANDPASQVSLYSFSYRAGQLRLEHVGGSTLLMQVLPLFFPPHGRAEPIVPATPKASTARATQKRKEIAKMEPEPASAPVASTKRERVDPSNVLILVDTDGRRRFLVQRLDDGEWKYVIGNGRSGGETIPIARIEDVIQHVIFHGRTVTACTADKKGTHKRSGVTVPGRSIRGYWVSPELRHLVRNAPTPPMEHLPDED